MAVADPDWEWPVDWPLNTYLVRKGSSRFLIVELPESGIHWMEPKDCLKTKEPGVEKAGRDEGSYQKRVGTRNQSEGERDEHRRDGDDADHHRDQQ